MKNQPKILKPPQPGQPGCAPPLLQEVRDLILAARRTVARGVNSALVLLYWKIGGRIRKDVLKAARAGYGDEILSTLSKELVAEFGRGFSWPNLSRMMALAEAFPDQKILVTLSQVLGWSHFVELLPLKQPLQREFYSERRRPAAWGRPWTKSARGSRQRSRDGRRKDPKSHEQDFWIERTYIDGRWAMPKLNSYL